jgi:hypothetical protein
MRELVAHSTGSFSHPDDPGEPSTGNPRLSVTALEAEILAAFVVDRNVLEVGTGLGVSTRALARTAKMVVTVDIDEWVHDTIWPDLPGNVVPTPVVPTNKTFDAAFIDGDHSTEAVLEDFWAVAPMVRRGGVILAHDTEAPNVRAGLPPLPEWQWLTTTHGIGVLWVAELLRRDEDA